MKRIFRRAFIWILGALLITGLWGCSGLKEVKINQDIEVETSQADVNVYQDQDTSYISRVNGKEFQLYDGSEFEDFYSVGVNLGSGQPNSYPGELAISESDYYDWLEEIGEMNANSIRVYTVMMPAFYEALYRYDSTHQDKIYLFQGCWYDEDTIGESEDAFDVLESTQKDLKDLVNIIHGNATVAEKTGHAYGEYTYDVSPYVIGWILGIESDQSLVEGTNTANESVTSYQGDYLSCTDVQPYEVFWAQIGDYVLSYEDSNYGMQRPISFTNWPTADLKTHPNEPLEKEDAVSLTVKDLSAGEKLKTGIFASYHVYPYYPNFMFKEEPYCSYVDQDGNVNPYLCYLKELNEQYSDMPLLIAEFGVPVSRGITHINDLTGFNQGGHTEEEQGQEIVSMYQDIEESGCMGGLVFSWQDEWFKRTWNTMEATNSDNRAFWSDMETCEQHFGFLEFVSNELGDSTPVIDGDDSEWSQDDILIDDDGMTLSMKEDSTYIYLMLNIQDADYDNEETYVYLDLNQSSGCNTYKDVSLKSDADYVLDINGRDQTRLEVEESSETYVRKTLTDAAYSQLNLKERDTDSFEKIYLVTDRELTYPETGETTPLQMTETGLMTYGSTDRESEDYSSLADFCYQGDVLEIRIPWGLLGFSAPNIKEINTPLEENTTTTINGINVGLISGDQSSELQEFTWDNWDQAEYKERLRDSYYIIQEYLETLK